MFDELVLNLIADYLDSKSIGAVVTLSEVSVDAHETLYKLFGERYISYYYHSRDAKSRDINFLKLSPKYLFMFAKYDYDKVYGYARNYKDVWDKKMCPAGNRRLPEEYEKVLLSSAKYAYNYVYMITFKDIKEAHPIILTSPEYSYKYSVYVLRRPWPKIPMALLNCNMWGSYYLRHWNNDPYIKLNCVEDNQKI